MSNPMLTAVPNEIRDDIAPIIAIRRTLSLLSMAAATKAHCIRKPEKLLTRTMPILLSSSARSC